MQLLGKLLILRLGLILLSAVPSPEVKQIKWPYCLIK